MLKYDFLKSNLLFINVFLMFCNIELSHHQMIIYTWGKKHKLLLHLNWTKRTQILYILVHLKWQFQMSLFWNYPRIY